MTQHRRNDEGFRNQNFGTEGNQQQGGGQFGGRQDQHSQYSGAGSQYGAGPGPTGGQFGSPCSNPYAQQAQGWAPSEQQSRHRYGAHGFGATGFGSGEYSGLGAFQVDQDHHEGSRQWQQERDQDVSSGQGKSGEATKTTK